jgi:hypothetical protein
LAKAQTSHPHLFTGKDTPRPITGKELRLEEENAQRVKEFHGQRVDHPDWTEREATYHAIPKQESKRVDIQFPPTIAHTLAAEGHREAQLVDPLYSEIRRLQLIIGSELDARIETIHDEFEDVWDSIFTPDDPPCGMLDPADEFADCTISAEMYESKALQAELRANDASVIEREIRAKADAARDAVLNDPTAETHRRYAEVMTELGEDTDEPEYGRGVLQMEGAKLAEALALKLDREILAAVEVESLSTDGFPIKECYANSKDPVDLRDTLVENGWTRDEDGIHVHPPVEAPDLVNSPTHYNQFGLECIDAIKLAVGEEGFVGYCHGNALKYLWRAEYKDSKRTDFAKAAWYARMAGGDDPRE